MNIDSIVYNYKAKSPYESATTNNSNNAMTIIDNYDKEEGMAMNTDYYKENKIILNPWVLESGYCRICLPDDVILYLEFNNQTGELEYLETQKNGWNFATEDSRRVWVDFKEREISE